MMHKSKVLAGETERIQESERGQLCPNSYPEGILENSPTFQRWVDEFRSAQVPKGRLKSHDGSAVPSGRILLGALVLTLKRWAIIACPFGTKTRSALVAASLGLLLTACALAGCKTISQPVSPRVEGRVIDSNSHQPIKDVVVKRLSANEDYNIDDPAKGGQVLAQAPSVRTSEAGTFVLQSIRDVAVFRHVSWYSVSLDFQHPGYTSLMATYTLVDATNRVDGEPTVRTGDILLVPRSAGTNAGTINHP